MLAFLISLIKPEDVPREYRSDLMQEIIRQNIQTEKFLSVLLIAIGSGLFCLDAATSDFWTNQIHIFKIFSKWHLLLILTAVLFLIIVKTADKTHVKNLLFYRICHMVLCLVVLDLCLVIAMSNFTTGKQLYPYMVAIFCITSLVFFMNFEGIILFISSYLIFLIEVFRLDIRENQALESMIFISLLVAMAIFISRRKYRAFIKSFLDNKLIVSKNEENKRLFKEAIEYDELKNEFFANISHEFRTPINVLLGTLQLMSSQIGNTSDSIAAEKGRRHVKIMRQNCFRLLRLTNNLIDMTRLDSGFVELELHNHNIVQVIEDITMSVAEYIEQKGITLIFDTDVEEKVIAVDADKIERILLNLLSNAVKFTKEQGCIWVNVRDRNDKIEISVKDTGSGIPQDKFDIIFERFRQVNSSLSRDNEGSGIGLSLVKSLVELHNGEISVKSEINKGSEFIVELPCTIVAEAEGSKPDVIYNKKHVDRISVEFSDIYIN